MIMKSLWEASAGRACSVEWCTRSRRHDRLELSWPMAGDWGGGVKIGWFSATGYQIAAAE